VHKNIGLWGSPTLPPFSSYATLFLQYDGLGKAG